MISIESTLPLLALASLIGCSPVGRAGVVLTFDDDFVDQWHAHADLLNAHGARATFLITRFDGLSGGALDQLRDLRDAGHEIGCHGLTHVSPSEYAEQYSVEAYIDDEVIPAVAAMREEGFDPRSFSHPWGGRTDALDGALLEHFAILRSSGRVDDPDTALHGWDDARVVRGARIDHGHAEVDEIEELLRTARRRNNVAVLYAHRILDSSEQSHIRPDELETVLEIVDELGLDYFTLTELAEPEGLIPRRAVRRPASAP